ncbi:hypothetical protein KP806_07675 [Paenibacillus sp. N4]|uniref:hypothetical protein n=1 Tax=Paenibacillus vietnamensis TaxID=2590547 RepID=UPI001CD0CA25|nr:hypothetical protein [Paenibacillus vietnamensis]MCA0754926.1 hypothetical protein [Paenibacillus vietnamensis]
MRIDNYYGKVVVLELDTMAKHEGVLEEVVDPEITGCVKIRNGAETWIVQRKDIVKITPIQPKRFIGK